MGFFEMLPLVAKAAVKRPATRRYPFEIRPDIAGTRGRVELDVAKCTFCTLCQRKCPAGAIQMDRQARTFTLDRFRCVVCGACQEACFTQKCIRLAAHYEPPASQRLPQTWRQTTPPPGPAAKPSPEDAKQDPQ